MNCARKPCFSFFLLFSLFFFFSREKPSFVETFLNPIASPLSNCLRSFPARQWKRPFHDFSGCRIKKGQADRERDRRKRTLARVSASRPARKRIIPCKWIMPRRCSLPTHPRSFSLSLSLYFISLPLAPCLLLVPRSSFAASFRMVVLRLVVRRLCSLEPSLPFHLPLSLSLLFLDPYCTTTRFQSSTRCTPGRATIVEFAFFLVSRPPSPSTTHPIPVPPSLAAPH